MKAVYGGALGALVALLSAGAVFSSAEAQADEDGVPTESAKYGDVISAIQDCADATSFGNFDATVLEDRGWRGVMQMVDGQAIMYASAEDLEGVSIEAPVLRDSLENACVVSDDFPDNASFAELASTIAQEFVTSPGETMQMGNDTFIIGQEVRTNSLGSRRFYNITVYEIETVE